MDISLDATEKIFSIIGVLIAIVGAVVWLLRRSPGDSEATANKTTTRPLSSRQIDAGAAPPSREIAELKRVTRVLFVDDDRAFKIVGVLRKMGWEHTKIVTDISSLEQPQLVESDVVFVDIQGVGKAMRYADEGLGLALAIKRRYSKKKVVIYSAQEEGSRFHEALQEADYSLPKTAEPIRFEDTIVRLLNS